MSSQAARKHIFISYAHADIDFVRRLTQTLQQSGINIWIDHEGLNAGESNWQMAIREAVRDAYAVLLIASPNSGQSIYVQSEVSLARRYQCPVFPLWASGDEWIDCIPLDMVNSQRIDCRGSQFETNLNKVLDVAKSNAPTKIAQQFLIDDLNKCPDGYFTVNILKNYTVAFKISAYRTLGHFLDVLYLGYLSDLYRPFTYGMAWILAGNNRTPRRLIVPWEWLSVLRDSLYVEDEQFNWSKYTLEGCGMVNKTHWKVLTAINEGGFGLATNDESLASDISRLSSSDNSEALNRLQLLLKENLDKVVIGDLDFSPTEKPASIMSPIKPNDLAYKYKFVFLAHKREYSGKMFEY